MKLTRDGWLGILVLLLLVAVTVSAALQQSKSVTIPYLSTSSKPNGTLALRMWVAELGYEAGETPQEVFELPQTVKTILVIQPIVSISNNEWKMIDNWVEKGGVLVIAGDNQQTFSAAGHFDFSLKYLQKQAAELTLAAPILKSPSMTAKPPVKADYVFATSRTDFTPLLSADDGQPVIVMIEQGKGKVILSTTPDIFSNLALKDDVTASLVLNILALSGTKGLTWFDEWHHGFQSGGIVGPGQWLQHTPGGHALLFSAGVIFMALLLQGRAFGRPIPLLHEVRRRGPLEHVTAIANLNRKAGHRNAVLKQFHQRVKRHLGQRYRIDPSLADAEYVKLLSQYNSAINKDDLLNLLTRLSQKNVNEGELLKLAAEAARWIKE